jgi:hypothetical protein
MNTDSDYTDAFRAKYGRSLTDDEIRLIQGVRALQPDVRASVAQIVSWRVVQDAQDRSQARRRPRLVDRLRAVHACQKTEAPGFVQLPTTGGPQKRQWMCDGCRETVTL